MKLSIIVPFYNMAADGKLNYCMDSLLGQTIGEGRSAAERAAGEIWTYEILAVDDCSTDDTFILLTAYAEKYPGRVRALKTPYNKKQGGARNLGIDCARGEWIGFMDGDDWAAPDMYEKLVKALIKSGKGIAQIGRDEIDESGKRLPDLCTPPEEEQEISYEDFLKELFLHRGDCSFCTKLIKRELLGKRRFPEGVLNEDFHLLVDLLAEEQADVICLPDYGYHVFYRSGSNTRKTDPEAFSRVYADNVDNALMVVRLAKEKLPRLKKEAFRFCVIQHLDYMLHIPISRMNREEDGFQQKVKWLRKSWPQAMQNPYLSKKNRLYHTLLALAPKSVRKIHEIKMKRKA